MIRYNSTPVDPPPHNRNLGYKFLPTCSPEGESMNYTSGTVGLAFSFHVNVKVTFMEIILDIYEICSSWVWLLELGVDSVELIVITEFDL